VFPHIISMHACLFLGSVWPSPQTLRIFPSHHSVWCLQGWQLTTVWTYRKHYKLKPLIQSLHLWGPEWAQAEHTLLPKALIWEVFGTQNADLPWQWTSGNTQETGAEALKLTALKGVLGNPKQNMPQQSSSPWTLLFDDRHNWSQVYCHRPYYN